MTFDNDEKNFFCTPEPEIVFDGNIFCFSGEFSIGSKEYCKKLVELHGGLSPSKSVTKKTTYLVVGSNDSYFWGHEGYGKKIEKAIENRGKGEDICIVSEKHFLKYIDKNIKVDAELRKNKKKKSSIKNYKIENSFVVLDLETTGLSPYDNEIIEIAAIKILDGKEETFTTLIKPYNKVQSGITKLTGITNDMLKKAPSVGEVIESFYDFIGDLPLVAHNASFDIRFLKVAFEAYELEYRENSVIDTLSLARSVLEELKNHKLKTLIEHFDIHCNRSHRALDDTMATLEIYRRLTV